jgi:hypothetical protein
MKKALGIALLCVLVGCLDTGFIIPLLVLVLGIAGVTWSIRRLLANQKRERLADEARRYMRAVKRRGSFESVSTHAHLKRGEVAIYSEQAFLYETRAVRHYASGRVGVRIMKGVWIGKSRGRSMSTPELTCIDDGNLIVTSKRLLFDGTHTNRAVALDDIMSTNCGLDYVEIASSRRQKSMIYTVPNPLLLTVMVRLCCQLDDPTNFDPDEVSISIK